MKVLIICAGDDKNPEMLQEYAGKSDYIICADGGYVHAKNADITPNILVGDFDSMSEPEISVPKIKLPCEKDETDTLYALRHAFIRGADEVVIYGALGGRFDHSYANVCLLFEALKRGISAIVTDGKTVCRMTDDKLILNEPKGRQISVFSFDDASEGVSIKGLKYEISDYTLYKYDIIGISNESLGEEAEISVKNGKLIVICN